MTILLLEDERTIREVLAEYLKVAGYDVLLAEDGEEALDIISRTPIDLAILDIMVPKLNGLEVLSRLRQAHPEIGVVMLTALDDEGTMVEAFNTYADDYIVKPVSPIILLKRVETILRRTKKSLNLQNSGLHLDNGRYQATYGGKDLGLTLTEFYLLQTLMRHPEQSLSREQLIEAVYHGDYFGSDRIIDSHVKNLRKKLPIDGIVTVTGIGYRWKGETL